MPLSSAISHAPVKRGVDPTNTTRLRRVWRADAQMRLRRFRAQMRIAVLDHDVLGIGNGGPMAYHTPAVRLGAFHGWLVAVAGQTLNGAWARPYLVKAWQSGLTAAGRDTGSPSTSAPMVDHLVQLVSQDCKGIGDAIVQQVGRVAERAMRCKRAAAWQLLAKTFDKVGVPRLDALCNTYTVKAHNQAKLIAYTVVGFSQVGIVPERRVKVHVHDADEEGDLVGIRTAGDDYVCEDCEDLADGAPYDIAEVEDLLPLHPNCRCTYFPWDDKRFKHDVATLDEFNPDEPRDPSGQWTSGGGSSAVPRTIEGRRAQYARLVQKARARGIEPTSYANPNVSKPRTIGRSNIIKERLGLPLIALPTSTPPGPVAAAPVAAASVPALSEASIGTINRMASMGQYVFSSEQRRVGAITENRVLRGEITTITPEVEMHLRAAGWSNRAIGQVETQVRAVAERRTPAPVAAPAPAPPVAARPAPPVSKYKKDDFTKAGLNLGLYTDEKTFIKLWETKVDMPPEQFKKEFLGGLDGTMNLVLREGKLHVGGDLIDKSKNKLANYSREIDFEHKSAYSAFFQVNSNAQDAGLGKKLLAGNVAMYQKLGLEKLKVSANIDVGGYAWARYGYVPMASWSSLKNTLQRRLDSVKDSDGKRQLSNMLLSSDPKTLWDIADSKYGKTMLLNTSWSGELNFKDRDAMDRFNAYVAGKTKKTETAPVVTPPASGDWPPPHEEDASESATSWDELTSAEQRDAEARWTSANFDSYYEGVVDNWRQEDAGHDAAAEVVTHYGNGQDEWADKAITEWRADREKNGAPRVPYTNDQLLDAVALDYEPDSGFEIKFDDDALNKPDTFDPAQMAMPVIGRADPSSALTKEMRDSLQEVIANAFKERSELVERELEPPSHLRDNVKDLLGETWNQMEDDDKFHAAREHGVFD